MIKFVCDRCGHEVNSALMRFNRRVIVIDGVARNEYDLCKDCVCEVRKFITGQTERNE